MKAMVMTAPGAPEVLQLRALPEPKIQHGRELLVRLYAAGVNPIDTKLRARGTYYPDRPQAILGLDGAGVVEAIGAEVKHYEIGDAVYFCNGGLGGHAGTYAEYAVIDERYAAPKPQSLSYAEAAAVPLVAITAWEALLDRGSVRQDQTVLVHGGAGGVGHLAIQLARLHGARVCTTVSDDAKGQLAKSLGAEVAINYRSTDFIAAVNSWSAGGVDVALDTVGGATLLKTLQVIGYAGELITLLQPGDDFDWKEARNRNVRIGLELMLTPMYLGLHTAQRHQADILKQCTAWFDTAKLRILVGDVLPLEQAVEAHRRLERGGMTGKLVLRVRDEAATT